ncbi:hypothetical protein E3J61_03820 [Candidatus Dependentiae bacterium]|nr:MAG: hypothetical protein E3J61_03820 [Candidatus Dependentiae bacterium]
MSSHTSTPLFRSFSSALSWNALAYLFHKSATTMRTFLLYYALSAHHFSMWATTTSAIFLLLLWLDLGLRKSIPRFAPLFSAQRTTLITTILIIHLSILLCALPFLIWFLQSHPPTILLLATIIYLAQGTQSIIRLAYHAYFLNKPFNIIATSSSVLELAALVSALILLPTHLLLMTTLTITAISSVGVCVIAYRAFFYPSFRLRLSATPDTAINFAGDPEFSSTETPTSTTYRQFFTHSLIMWITTIIKSFSERNFLLLLITSSSGVAVANIFKLANDGALFFYRIIIKTIGVADTALLAHIETGHESRGEKNSMMISAVKEVVAKTARLILPLLGILVVICFVPNRLYTPDVFHAFLLMTIGYILETILIPYERLLEVRRRYLFLFLSYLPYIGVMILLMFTLRISSIGLLPLLLCIHIVRLVSYLLIRVCTYYIYRI